MTNKNPNTTAHTEAIMKVASVASSVGFQAGVPALEIAGLIISVLSANPEEIQRFMSEGTELFIDGTIQCEKGCLTYTAMNGEILSPDILRRAKGIEQ